MDDKRDYVDITFRVITPINTNESIMNNLILSLDKVRDFIGNKNKGEFMDEEDIEKFKNHLGIIRTMTDLLEKEN